MLQNNKSEVVRVTLKESKNLKVEAGLRDIANKENIKTELKDKNNQLQPIKMTLV